MSYILTTVCAPPNCSVPRSRAGRHTIRSIVCVVTMVSTAGSRRVDCLSGKRTANCLSGLAPVPTSKTQKRTMQQLVQANADLQQFAYAAAHDLQEPIRGITLYTQLLRRKLPELSPEASTCVSHLFTSAERMEALVQDLLVYTQTSEKEETAAETVDCNDVLDYVRRNVESALEASSGEMICGDLPRLPGHRTRLVQVFQNLISNAIKYHRTDTPPRIVVHAERRKDEWVFSVADNGIGVAPEFHERIFGVFRRLHSREIPGTGIGLAICKRIVEDYGGAIWVTSAGEGQGSTFWFTLPADR